MQKAGSPHHSADMAGLISAHDPDLMFVQEASDTTIEAGHLGGHFAPSWSYPWPGGPATGVATMSKSPPAAVTAARAPWRELIVATPKVSLLSHYALANGEILLAINVHLMNFETWSPFMLRAQLDALGQAMARHKGPIILAGDFNTWNARRLATVEALTARFGLCEVEEFPPGRATGDPGNKPLRRLLGIDAQLPLDRVYIRGFRTLAAEVPHTRSSDHRPIVVTIGLVQ